MQNLDLGCCSTPDLGRLPLPMDLLSVSGDLSVGMPLNQTEYQLQQAMGRKKQ